MLLVVLTAPYLRRILQTLCSVHWCYSGTSKGSHITYTGTSMVCCHKMFDVTSPYMSAEHLQHAERELQQ